jgi:hypothetical protein
MSTKQQRPWYCIDALVDDYISVADGGGDLQMLKTLKIVRSLIVNIGIIAITLYGLSLGYEMWFGSLGLLTLGLYNGVEVADYAALAQAFAEARHRQQQQEREGNR